jgi:hypothetical protein
MARVYTLNSQQNFKILAKVTVRLHVQVSDANWLWDFMMVWIPMMAEDRDPEMMDRMIP